MGKQKNRGFYLHGFNFQCWRCCCSVCTAEHCPYYNEKYGVYRNRCARCVRANGKIPKVLDCDFFENRHTSRRKFKVKRRFHKPAPVMERLDAIMEKLGIENLKEGD